MTNAESRIVNINRFATRDWLISEVWYVSKTGRLL